MRAVYLLICTINLLCLCGMSRGTDISEMAYKLRNITITLFDENPEINPSILLALNKIISRLDPTYELGTKNLLVNPTLVPDTCKEVYLEAHDEVPWYNTGFIVAPSCKQEKKQPIHELISILILDREQDTNRTCNVLQTIHSYNSNIQVILGSNAAVQVLEAEYKNIVTVTSDGEDLLRPGKILNLMAKQIKTPYVLIARDVFYFNDMARLERQVFVISSTDVVGVAGGSFRNETGYWKVGCHFSEIKKFFLQYTEGYKYSALDCMLCDHLEGPFVARTSIMRDIPFMNNLYEEVLFEDWFLRVKQRNILTMNCPDVMYFKRGLLEGVTNEVKLREHSSWLGLAKEWQVDHIQFPSRVSIKFACKEVNITCNRKEWTNAFLIPNCCMGQVTGALKALDTFSVAKRVDYEIESGTLLGAVKSRNVFPWYEDGDITFLNKDYITFYDNIDLFQDKGFNMSRINESYFHLNTPEITLKMWGENQISTIQLPKEMREYPTRIKFNGIWVRGEWNPGWLAIKRYGPGFLKAMQNWRR